MHTKYSTSSGSTNRFATLAVARRSGTRGSTTPRPAKVARAMRRTASRCSISGMWLYCANHVVLESTVRCFLSAPGCPSTCNDSLDPLHLYVTAMTPRHAVPAVASAKPTAARRPGSARHARDSESRRVSPLLVRS